MPLPVSSISAAHLAPTPKPAALAPAASSGGFSSMLQNAIQSVEAPGNAAGQAIQNMLSGGSEELHTVALAVQRADLTFDLAMQVRNKVISAYQEIMKMQL
jgi:flagellar hook-basal body complex protein FliE